MINQNFCSPSSHIHTVESGEKKCISMKVLYIPTEQCQNFVQTVLVYFQRGIPVFWFLQQDKKSSQNIQFKIRLVNILPSPCKRHNTEFWSLHKMFFMQFSCDLNGRHGIVCRDKNLQLQKNLTRSFSAKPLPS